MRLKSSVIDSYLIIFFFTMISFGFVVSSFVPIFLGLSTTPFNVLFRASYLGLSIYLILKSTMILPKEKYSWTFWVMLTFVVFYSGRMVYDVYIQDLVFKFSILDHFLFSFGGNFIPFLAIALFAKRVDYDLLLKVTWYLLFISGILLLVLLYKIFGGLSIEMLARRMALSGEEGKGNNINAITLSIYGSSLALMSFYFLLFKHEFGKGVLIFATLLGMAILVMGASRGPQVTFVVCLVYMLATHTFRHRKRYKSKLNFAVGIAAVLAAILYLISKIDLNQIAMYKRFADFGEGLSSDTSAREKTWSLSWQQFLDAPIFGDAYLVRPWYGLSYGTYPHNIYLEVLMATGILGAILFFPAMGALLLRRVRNVNQIGIKVLLLAPVIASLFSGNLFFNPNLFSAIALMTAFAYINGRDLRVYE